MSDTDENKYGLEPILTKKELRRFVPYTPQHIARLEKAGTFPKRVKLGPNRVGWIASEIAAWLENLKRQRAPGRDGEETGTSVSQPSS